MALREVNLVPEEILDRIRTKRHVALWAACLVAGVLIVAAVFGQSMYRMILHRPPLRDTAEMEGQIKTALADVQSVQTELDALSFIDRISERQSYADVLYVLSTLMSTNTWLGELRLNDRGDRFGSKQATMSGYGFSNTDVGTLVSRLSHEPLFGAVDLKLTEERDTPLPLSRSRLPDHLVYFEIECVVGRER